MEKRRLDGIEDVGCVVDAAVAVVAAGLELSSFALSIKIRKHP